VKEAKMQVLKELKKLMGEEMVKDFKGLRDKEELGTDSIKKVTVAAPDDEGLKKGLSKANELVGEMGEAEEEDEMEEESEESEEMSDAEKLAKLEEELAALKAKMLAKA
jgi:hypothetical protein